jgi:hypothetical protein
VALLCISPHCAEINAESPPKSIAPAEINSEAEKLQFCSNTRIMVFGCDSKWILPAVRRLGKLKLLSPGPQYPRQPDNGGTARLRPGGSFVQLKPSATVTSTAVVAATTSTGAIGAIAAAAKQNTAVAVATAATREWTSRGAGLGSP